METKKLKHIGIILDGNRRWAKEHKLTTFKGHLKGYENMRTIANYWFGKEAGLTMTVYAFSTENWNRTKKEVGYLMKLLRRAVTEQTVELHKNGIKLNILGLRAGLDKDIIKAINQAEEKTKNNKKGTFNICINYGGRDEIVNAVQKIIEDKVPAKKIDKALIEKYLWTHGQPDPDFIIRTSGEMRLSNFLTWQGVYSELYFPKMHWPAFTPKDLDAAIEEYYQRHRRFGGN